MEMQRNVIINMDPESWGTVVDMPPKEVKDFNHGKVTTKITTYVDKATGKPRQTVAAIPKTEKDQLCAMLGVTVQCRSHGKRCR